MTNTDRLFGLDGDLISDRIVDRPNRFVVTVRFDNKTERAYLADPGTLEGLLVSGREILCSPVENPNRSTEYDAIAVQKGDIYVSVRAVLANELFEAALTKGLVPRFDGYSVLDREPKPPDHGRTDFLLETPTRERAYVEVKSCTHVEDGVAKFPDRQTERGRRHLRALESLLTAGYETAVVFVVQRPDVELFRPYSAVDPAFAELLGRVHESGVAVHALSTAFDPPCYRLHDRALSIDLP